MSAKDQRREKAAHLLRLAAMKTGDAQLAKLAVSVKADVFAEVKKAIDGMIAELSKIQKEEEEQYEFCTSELKANEKQTEAKTELKAQLEQTIADSESAISRLTEDIKTLKAEIA